MSQQRAGELALGDEAREALAAGQPVVALETAVVSHGLPAPDNMQAMQRMVDRVRMAGAVPAICLVADGCLHVGADMALVGRLAADPGRLKVSVRDLGLAMCRGSAGGLTVSGTLRAAHLAGIRVFATGGIGGVHLGNDFDVSADLHQLARTPAVTVCSGAKSVLDIRRTLEYLETLGVPVYAYRTAVWPAFYLRESEQGAVRLESPEEIAGIALAEWSVRSDVGLVIGNPIPAEAAVEVEFWSSWLAQAEQSARREGVTGPAVTPYLLERVAALSEGRTVMANLALLESNAALAARVAVALAQ